MRYSSMGSMYMLISRAVSRLMSLSRCSFRDWRSIRWHCTHGCQLGQVIDRVFTSALAKRFAQFRTQRDVVAEMEVIAFGVEPAGGPRKTNAISKAQAVAKPCQENNKAGDCGDQHIKGSSSETNGQCHASCQLAARRLFAITDH